MRNKSVLILVGLLTFIAIVGGISYSYFVYNKKLGDVSIDTGEIAINYSSVSGNLSLSNVIPMSDNIGMVNSNYIDFTVDATVDKERIYYEVYLMPKSGNTLNTDYLKLYLTDQEDNMLKNVIAYYVLPNSEKENGKAIYRGIVELNNNETTKQESKDFRLRLWLDESYPDVVAKSFEFDIYLYAKNVDSEFVIPQAFICPSESCVQASVIRFDNSVTGFSNCNSAQCTLVKIDEMLNQ